MCGSSGPLIFSSWPAISKPHVVRPLTVGKLLVAQLLTTCGSHRSSLPCIFKIKKIFIHIHDGFLVPSPLRPHRQLGKSRRPAGKTFVAASSSFVHVRRMMTFSVQGGEQFAVFVAPRRRRPGTHGKLQGPDPARCKVETGPAGRPVQMVRSRSLLVKVTGDNLFYHITNSPPTKANQVRFPAGSSPNFRMWKTYRMIPLVGGLTRRSLVSPAPSFLALLHSHLTSLSSALKTSMLRAAQFPTPLHFTNTNHELQSCCISQVYEESPTVKISQGSLLGAASSTADGSRYYQFLGIPYAKPPLGDLRFAAPEDPESWSGVRNATKYGSTCYQVGEDGGSEDCLFVNVFTPQLPTNGSNTSLLPVMVYIHGGAFVSGSGNMSPGQLLNYGLVVATINYRLNVFGFLSINGTDAPGNAGLKDQSAALRWIQKTIAKFGGDPNNVTIFGASAGGASIHYNILSPLSKGLFHRAISESGSALNPWAFFKNTEARALRLGAILGNKTDSATELLSVLRAASGKDLLTAINHILTAEESERLISNPFVPSLEFPRKGEKPFLPHEPSYLVENGLFNKVPYITGVTKNESLVFVYQQILLDSSYWQDINKDLEQVVPVDLGLVKGSAQSLEVAQKVISFYFGNKTISNETISQWLDLQTDLLFATGVVKTVHAHAKHSTSATYNYQFVYGVALHTMEFSFVTYGGSFRVRTIMT
ncbi:hypothetical protein PR048_005725 [Dryococelus australis]|uniref:Carboxylesterase type B domain-containing protein n=1 Tax=Dryococelus australis TaxID=614101 RepID=A0ABQ9I8Z3_9NEOP|nr:hypothetical protein PR048_005725 [Dryococelus australis]